jgi:hypothetical protein
MRKLLIFNNLTALSKRDTGHFSGNLRGCLYGPKNGFQNFVK